MNKVKKIEFVLENCEVITQDIIEQSYYNGIIGRTQKSYHWQGNDLFENIFCKFVELSFETEYFKPIISNYAGPQEDGYKRLSYGDVTSIVFVFEDDTQLQIYVPWKGDDFRNKLFKMTRHKTEHHDHIRIKIDGNGWWIKFKNFISLIALKIRYGKIFYKEKK